MTAPSTELIGVVILTAVGLIAYVFATPEVAVVVNLVVLLILVGAKP